MPGAIPAQRRPLGSITVVFGPMFANKTTTLLAELKEAVSKGRKVMAFKPKIDDRYHPINIVAHSKDSYPAIVVTEAKQILDAVLAEEILPDDVFLEEIEFIEDSRDDRGKDGVLTLDQVVVILKVHGCYVHCYGLNRKHDGTPFIVTACVMAVGDTLRELKADCDGKCHRPNSATYSRRLDKSKGDIKIGNGKDYCANCDDCYFEDKR
ncbi:MAG: hypothetical protein V1763_01670 [Parcubacteria group bacterium]